MAQKEDIELENIEEKEGEKGDREKFQHQPNIIFRKKK